MSLDVLVFGPHPDDIEIGLGGTIARHAAAGDRVGLCDLTAGELGSNGTPEIRMREADAAARVLGAAFRENLHWPDGNITSSPELIRSAVDCIRRHRPRTIAIPFAHDRHPDHLAANQVLTKAIFMAGLRKYETGAEPWRADWVCAYFINDSASPSFVIDVSAHYEKKRAALACYASQFTPAGDEAIATRLTAPTFRQLVESRDAQFGALAGVAFAEGFATTEPIERGSLLKGRP